MFGPTGQVFSQTTGFIIPSDGKAASFIFANLDGSISAWNNGLTPATAAVVVVQPIAWASFTGLALANGLLYAADKGSGTIDVFDSSFVRRSILTDPNLPAGTPHTTSSYSAMGSFTSPSRTRPTRTWAQSRS